jgi:hypothetical protein
MLRLSFRYFCAGRAFRAALVFGKRGAVYFCHNGGDSGQSDTAEAVDLPGTARIAILALRRMHLPGGAGSMSVLLSHSSVVAFVLCSTLVQPARAQTGGTAKQIDVVANDYAFTLLPAHISAGPTIFAFANQGKVRHEMSIARLKAGATPEEMVKAFREETRRRDFVERSVGILIAGPGKSPDGRLLVDLVRGSTYVLFCNLKDTPDSPGHTMLGMYTTFRPE